MNISCGEFFSKAFLKKPFMKEEYNSMNIPDYENQPQNNQLSKCPNCGQEVGDWAFCFYCGTNLKAQSVNELPDEETEQLESEIDNTLDDTIEIQQETTEVKAPICPNCGKEIGEWDFCFHCGTNLKALPVAEQPDNEFEIIKSLVANESNTGIEELPETQNDNIIVLEDENGNSVEFEFLDLIQYRGKEYVVLLPNDDSIEKVIILQLEETSDGTESYLSVDNEYTLQVVFEIFKERAKNEFNFID